MGKFTDELRDLDSLFGTAPEPDVNGVGVPDGIYRASLITADIIRGTQNPEDLFLKCDFGVEGGVADGNMIHLLQRLTVTENTRMNFLKRLLRTLGYEEDSLSGLEDFLGSALGRYYEVKVATKGQYTNIYVNRQMPNPSETPSDFPDGLPF